MTAGHGSPPARVAVLGPLLLTVDGAAVDVRGPKRRVVLALLALAEGRAVTVDSLVDALWPAEVPDSGRQALHSHVSRLRAHLGPAAARLQTGLDGHRLDVGQDDLDLVQARALLAAVRADADRDPAAALSLLREAHVLWRGPVLADLTDVGPIAAAVQGCAHLHRDVTDAIVATAIAAGQANAVLDLPRSPWPPTRSGSPRCSCRCARWRPPVGPRRHCGPDASTGAGWPMRRVSTRHRR